MALTCLNCHFGKMSKTARDPALSEVQKQVGSRIRRVRELYDIAQADLAKALLMDGSTLNKIEKGSRPPNVFNVISLANRLRVSTDYILRGQLIGRMDEQVALQLAAKYPELVPPMSREQGKDKGMP